MISIKTWSFACKLNILFIVISYIRLWNQLHMPSTELIISINQADELPPGFIRNNLSRLLLLNDYLENLPDWAMQYFSQQGLSEDSLPDAEFVQGDEDFPAIVRLSALELTELQFLQAFINSVSIELNPLLEAPYPLTLTFQIPADKGF